MKDNLTLGQKVKYYRIQANISQFELENRIGASPGSLSRIENDQINPTKETPLKIIQALNLNVTESLNLFGLSYGQSNTPKNNIGLNDFESYIERLHSNLDLDKIFTLTLKEIIKSLRFKVPSIYLLDETRKYLFLVEVDVPTIAIKVAENIVGDKIHNFVKYDLSNKHSVLAECVNKKAIVQTRDFSRFTMPFFDKKTARAIETILQLHVMLAIPLIIDGKVIGAMAASSIDDEVTEEDIIRMEVIARQVAIAINNSLKFNNLKQELHKLEVKLNEK